MSQDTQTETGQPGEHDEVARLVKQAERGDLSVLPELRRLLEDNEALWQSYGDLAAQAEAALIRLVAGPNLLLAECLKRKVRAMTEELGGASPSRLERLLAERVTSTWMQVHYYDALAAQVAQAGDFPTRALERRQDGSQRRFLASVKLLAVVQKLLKPAPSPIQIATRLNRGGADLRREGITGTAESMN